MVEDDALKFSLRLMVRILIKTFSPKTEVRCARTNNADFDSIKTNSNKKAWKRLNKARLWGIVKNPL